MKIFYHFNDKFKASALQKTYWESKMETTDWEEIIKALISDKITVFRIYF